MIKRLDRAEHFRRLALARRLRSVQPDFPRSAAIASIIGDDVADQIRAHGLYEGEILHFLKDRFLGADGYRDSVAVDVGANIGNHSLFFSTLFKRVIAIEPNPIALALLRLNLMLNDVKNVEVVPVGLSDQDRNEPLLIDSCNLGASRLRRSASAPRSVRSEAGINLVRGDSILETADRVGLIKVDVEGAEYEALRGLEATICRDRPVIVVEQMATEIDGGSSPTFEFLRGLGYDAWEFHERTHFSRGLLNNLLNIVRGYAEYRLTNVSALEKRHYPAIIFEAHDTTRG